LAFAPLAISSNEMDPFLTAGALAAPFLSIRVLANLLKKLTTWNLVFFCRDGKRATASKACLSSCTVAV